MITGIVDSHSHLDFEQFSADLEAVISRAKAAGIAHVMVPGIDLDSMDRLLATISGIEMAICAVGVHPHCAKQGLLFDEQRADALVSSNPQVAAVGEIGLDYYRELPPREDQRELFKSCLRWAKKRELPVIVHMREAFEDVYAILRETQLRQNPGVMHCFSGGIEEARKFLDLGYMISFAGQITYPNTKAACDVVEYVPLERLLIETDAPFLAPQPVRGKRNEPAFIIYTIEKIAALKGIDPQEVADATARNAGALFGLGID